MKRVELDIIQHTIFSGLEPMKMHFVVGEAGIIVANNNFHNTSDIISNSNAYINRTKTKYGPLWTGDSYLLVGKSKLKNRATDSEDLGRIQKTVRKE